MDLFLQPFLSRFSLRNNTIVNVFKIFLIKKEDYLVQKGWKDMKIVVVSMLVMWLCLNVYAEESIEQRLFKDLKKNIT